MLGFLVARGTLYRAHSRAGRVEFARLESLSRVQELLEGLTARPDELGPAEALGALLWPQGPVSTRVLIAADGPLANLSFAGLRRRGRWLVEDHVVSRVPSLGAATLAHRAVVATDGTQRVLGDPTRDLPHAAAEAMVLARTLGVSPSLGSEATTGKLMSSCGADFFHFAGHSGLGAEGAWLALADGQVTASALLAAHCAPRLVYLASCASAVAVRGRAAATLADAFYASGSVHVVATTRSVSDEIAATFTRAFFSEGKVDHPPERLAEVQRRLSVSHSRSWWEPFVVLGL